MKLVFLAALVLAGGAWGQEQPIHELCGACHTEIVSEFKTHPHFAKGIFCDACHGKSEKHRMAGGNAEPDRVAGPTQVPALCGGCHTKPVSAASGAKTLLEEFLQSKHGQAVMARNRGRAPNCGTCHGVHGVRSAKAIETRCERCHESLPAACSGQPAAAAKVRCAGCHTPHLFAAAR